MSIKLESPIEILDIEILGETYRATIAFTEQTLQELREASIRIADEFHKVEELRNKGRIDESNKLWANLLREAISAAIGESKYQELIDALLQYEIDDITYCNLAMQELYIEISRIAVDKKNRMNLVAAHDATEVVNALAQPAV